MVEYNTINAKLSDSQLNKLKTVVKYKQGTTLRMNARMFNGNNLPHELLLTTRQTTKLRNTIENNMSTDIKLSKAQISKIIQSVGFLGSLLSKIAGPLMKVAVPFAKKNLPPLGLTVAMSAIDARIQKKIHGSGTTTLIISNKEMNDIIKIVQALDDSYILWKGVTKTIKNETKEQKGGFLSMLLGTLGASLLGNVLSRKGAVRAGYGSSIKKKLIPPHSLTDFEIKEYYENEPRFNGVYSRDNLPKTIKNGPYVVNLDEYLDVGTLDCFVCKNNGVTYFDSFGVEHVSKEIKRFIGHKNTEANIFRIQADNSIMCGYFCIGFKDFLFANKTLIDFTSLFSPYEFKKNDDIILSYFK